MTLLPNFPASALTPVCQMKCVLLALILLLTSHAGISQPAIKNKFTTYLKVYQLNVKQYEDLNRFHTIHDSLKLFTNYIKKVHVHNERFIDSMPYGHYLGVRAQGTHLFYKVYSKPFFKTQSFGINGEVWHIITDQNDKVLKEVTVSYQNNTYPYRADCNCYPIPAKSGTDTLLLTYNGHYQFYRSTVNINQPPEYKEQSNVYNKTWWSPTRILPGYVAFNQPMYRQNDTVKVKAFLTNEKGRPWKKKRVLVKYTTPGGKTVVLGKIKRQTEGAYVTEFVVPESYHLGTYQLSFWKTWDEVKLRDESFQILDYHLTANNTYGSRATQQVYHRGQDVVFILKAEDVNGLTLLDAKAKVSIQATHFQDFYDKLFYWNGKPETYSFEKEVLFDVAGETVITFPDSLFPNNKMGYRATITYTNDLQQLYSNVIDFTFDAKPTHFEFKRTGDSLTVDHYMLGKPTPYSRLKLLSIRYNETIEEKWIDAPYREKIDLFYTKYVLVNQHGQNISELEFKNHGDVPVSLSGHRTHDSILIRLNNDLQMPVSYQVFKRDQKIAGGQWIKGDNTQLYVAVDSSLDDYHVFYSTLWNNKHFIKEQIFYTDETKLNVDINQPDIVFPGSSIPVEVKVTDYKQNNVEGANITAYSVNDLFPETPLPGLPYFGRLHQPYLNRFNVVQTPFVINQNRMLEKDDFEMLGFRETPYYDFAYAKNGIGIFQDSIGGKLAELAIYALQMHGSNPIHVVYLNDVPVAINGASNRNAYVFVKPAGEYQLKIRTANQQYTINKVKLIAGEKTYLCLNRAFVESNPDVTYLNINEPPFTDEERAYLEPTFLYLKKGNDHCFIEQDGFMADLNQLSSGSRFTDNGSWYYMVGPLKKGPVNLYNQTKDTLMTFDYYPNYLYSQIDSSGQIVVDKPRPQHLEKLRYGLNTHYQDWNFNFRPRRWTDFLPKEKVEVKKETKKEEPIVQHKVPEPEINYDNPARSQQLRGFRPQTYNQKNAAAINIKNNTGKSIWWSLLNNQVDPKSSGAWYTKNFNIEGITPGVYDLMILFTDSSYCLVSNFYLEENGTTYYRLDSADVKPINPEVQTYYEEIIVAANRSPLNTFVNNPLYFQKIHLKTIKSRGRETVLSGFLVNTYNRPLNGINLIFEKKGKFQFGALTNRDGYFELKNVEPGLYTIKIGDCLPYQVYEDLMVKKGVNTRIVIGNDPALRMNKEGELYVEMEEEPAEEPIYETVIVDNNNYLWTSDNVQASASYSSIDRAPAISNVSLFASQVTGVVQPTEYNSLEYPNVKGQEHAPNNRLEEYARQNGMDKATMELIRQNDSLNRIRDNYRDYGYWVPNLVTDKNGSARFTVQFPDNITRWKTIVPAMTGNQQTGIGVKYAQAFKPLSAHLGIPSYLITGDSIQLEGKILNYTNESMTAKTWFKLNDDTLTSGLQSTSRTITEQQWLSHPKPETVTVGYGLRMDDGYLDGEERELRVITNTFEQIKGELILMEEDSILTLTPDQAKHSVYIFNKPLGIYETEINRLKAYKYGCNEQTASKLKALLLEQKMATTLEMPFTGQKDIKTCIKILTENRNTDGSYGWWGRSRYDHWITNYVLDALSKASKTNQVDNYMSAARFLKSHLNTMPVSNRLTSLNTLASIPFPMDYQEYIQALDTINLSLQDQFKLLYLKQQQDSTLSIDTILTSYIEAPEGIFWGEQFFNGYINKWETSAIAYKILKNAGGHEELMRQMRDYFLQLDPETRNTFERATLLDLFLEDELLVNGTLSEFVGDVWINGRKIESFPYYESFEVNDTINIRKSGKRVGVQVNTHTITKTPQGNDSLLTVESWFQQSGKPTDSLDAGEPVTYIVDVNVKEDMKYVILEIPIPASCIYNQKKASRNGLESYREEFRHMTAISCATLPKGSHQFRVNLIPRFDGQFQALPVKVEDMYVPVNVNYSKVKHIVVKK